MPNFAQILCKSTSEPNKLDQNCAKTPQNQINSTKSVSYTKKCGTIPSVNKNVKSFQSTSKNVKKTLKKTLKTLIFYGQNDVKKRGLISIF